MCILVHYKVHGLTHLLMVTVQHRTGKNMENTSLKYSSLMQIL